MDDGDTIIIDDSRRIRYIGINAPELAHGDEPAEPFGNDAASFNRQMVMNRLVRLEFDQQLNDRYGRFLAYVFLKDGTCANVKMIQAGYAYCLPHPPNIRYENRLLEHQRQAMNTRKGIWAYWKDRYAPVVGNKHSKRFHAENCPFGIKTEKRNRISFPNSREAFFSGYAPCSRCIKTN